MVLCSTLQENLSEEHLAKSNSNFPNEEVYTRSLNLSIFKTQMNLEDITPIKTSKSETD